LGVNVEPRAAGEACDAVLAAGDASVETVDAGVPEMELEMDVIGDVMVVHVESAEVERRADEDDDDNALEDTKGDETTCAHFENDELRVQH
jgi:hypothetical protein